MPKITVIPALQSFRPEHIINKRRVAGYARVSTEAEEQASSFEMQCSYYESYIKNRADWDFVGIYSDEGISGTRTKNREGFNTMINDALSGKIDLIVTKSVSRFARNTVDAISTIRKLKEKNIECFFEKENIYTLSENGELLLTIMSSLAQEESRSLSENVKWGKRKTFAQGKVNLNYGRFLGYNKKVDGSLEIVEDEAEVVRTVFCLYLDGNSIQDIAEILTQRRIPTATDKEKWCTRTVANMLRNEKYKGDALLQKWYSKDYLTKHQVANRGELPQYYIENHHEAIIDSIIFDAVNLEMKRREGHKVTAAGLWCKVICPECGSTCTPIISRKNVIFECRNKNRNITECKTPTVKKQVILDGFMQALSSLDKEEALKNASAQLDRLVIKSEVLQRIEACRASMQKAANDMTSLNKNRKCEDYEIRHNEIEVCYNETYRELQNLEANIQDIKAKRTHLTCFIKVLSVPITEFEPKLWLLLLDRAELNKDGTVSYVLRNGARI